MKTIKKIFWRALIILVVLIIAAVVIVGIFLDGIVKKSVETVGPRITKVPVTLNAVHLSLLTGSAKIDGLVVGNPAGYTATNAISVGSAAVGVNPFSVLSDKIVVRSIRVVAPEITFEGNPFGKNNLTQIRDNVSGPAQPAQKPAAPAKPAKPAKKIEVDDFLITGAKVHLPAADLTLSLPDIHLTDLGKGPDGITAVDLTKRVLDALTTSTLKAVTSSANKLGKGVESLGKQAASNSVEKIKKGLGGLFGK